MKHAYCGAVILIFVILCLSLRSYAAPTIPSQRSEWAIISKISKLMEERAECDLQNIKNLLCSTEIRCEQSKIK